MNSSVPERDCRVAPSLRRLRFHWSWLLLKAKEHGSLQQIERNLGKMYFLLNSSHSWLCWFPISVCIGPKDSGCRHSQSCFVQSRDWIGKPWQYYPLPEYIHQIVWREIWRNGLFEVIVLWNSVWLPLRADVINHLPELVFNERSNKFFLDTPERNIFKPI